MLEEGGTAGGQVARGLGMQVAPPLAYCNQPQTLFTKQFLVPPVPLPSDIAAMHASAPPCSLPLPTSHCSQVMQRIVPSRSLLFFPDHTSFTLGAAVQAHRHPGQRRALGCGAQIRQQPGAEIHPAGHEVRLWGGKLECVEACFCTALAVAPAVTSAVVLAVVLTAALTVALQPDMLRLAVQCLRLDHDPPTG